MSPWLTQKQIAEKFQVIRRNLFLGLMIGLGAMPLLAHSISQVFSDRPIEFPPIIELLGLVVALVCANAATPVIGKSARELVEVWRDFRRPITQPEKALPKPKDDK